MIIGQNCGVMYKTETVYGTAVAATTAIGGKVSDFSPTLTNNIQAIRGLGYGRNVAAWILGNFDAAFSISWDVGDMTFLQYQIGTLSGAGTSDSAPKILTESETFGVGASDIKPFTMIVNKEDGSSDMEDTYSGCVLNEVTISVNIGGTVTATAKGFAQNYSSGTTIGNAYTPSTLAPYIGAQANLEWGSSPTAVAKIVSCSVTFNNNAIIYRSIGSRFMELPVAGWRDYLWTITVRESIAIQSTLLNNFLVDLSGSAPYTPGDSIVSAEPTAGLKLSIIMAEGTGSSDRKATIQLDESALFDFTQGIRVENDVVQVNYNGGSKEGVGNVPIAWVD